MTLYLPSFMIVGNGSTLPTVLDCWGPNICKSRKDDDLPFAISILFLCLWVWHFSSMRTTDFTFRVRDLFFQREPAAETLSKSAASAFCITAGHICPNYGSTWMAPGSQCSSEFVILKPVPIGHHNRWLKNESPVPAVWVSHMFLGNLVLLCKKQEILHHALNHILTAL